MTDRLSQWRRRDDGAFAVIYAVLVVLIVGLLAIVVDTSQNRVNRRANRAAVDAGAIAGARSLGYGSGTMDPRQACKTVVAYVNLDRGVSLPTTGCTNNFSDSVSTCPSSETTATLSSGNYSLAVTWPVLNPPNDTSGLMGTPDSENLGLTQASVAADGAPCARLGVSMSQIQPASFGAIYGNTQITTTSHSVAVAAPGPGVPTLVAPLVVLDPQSCNALSVTGGAHVIVYHSPTTAGTQTPGYIAVDSDGSATNTTGDVSCAGSQTIINANSTNGSIDAASTSTSPAIPGQIFSYGIWTNSGNVYNPQIQSTCPSGTTTGQSGYNLCPTPTFEITRTGSDFVVDRYDCGAPNGSGQTQSSTYQPYIVGYSAVYTDPNTACLTTPPMQSATGPYNYIDQLHAYAEGIVAATPSGWTVVSGSTACTSPASSYTGNVLINCPSNKPFTVKNTVAFKGDGMVISTGDINVSGGCLVFNARLLTSAASAYCGTAPTASLGPGPFATDGPPVVLFGGLSLSATGASLIAPQTMIYQPAPVGSENYTPQLSVNAGAGQLYWTAPVDSSVSTNVGACTPATSSAAAPTAPCFAKLALWNELTYTRSNSPTNLLQGQSGLTLQGTFFAPNDQFQFGGGSSMNLTLAAQFIAKRLVLNGQGTLTLVPDSSKENSALANVGTLIR